MLSAQAIAICLEIAVINHLELSALLGSHPTDCQSCTQGIYVHRLAGSVQPDSCLTCRAKLTSSTHQTSCINDFLASSAPGQHCICSKVLLMSTVVRQLTTGPPAARRVSTARRVYRDAQTLATALPRAAGSPAGILGRESYSPAPDMPSRSSTLADERAMTRVSGSNALPVHVQPVT